MMKGHTVETLIGKTLQQENGRLWGLALCCNSKHGLSVMLISGQNPSDLAFNLQHISAVASLNLTGEGCRDPQLVKRYGASFYLGSLSNGGYIPSLDYVWEMLNLSETK